MIPHGLFDHRSTLCIMIAGFAYGGSFQSLMTFIPLYLTVLLHHDAMTTNLELLCLVLFACIFNVVFGLLIVRTGKYVWAPRVSLAIIVCACGLLQLWTIDTSVRMVVGILIVLGVGCGGMINSEIITAQASVSIEQYVHQKSDYWVYNALL
jgi:MFS family permease